MTLAKLNSIDSMIRDFLNEFPAPSSAISRQDALHFPPVNITETEKAFILDMSVPGFDKKDFRIGMDGQILNIAAEINTESEIVNGKKIRREFSTRSFKRSFTLNDRIDAENIGAAYDKGILTVELPKKSEETNKQKAIEVK